MIHSTHPCSTIAYTMRRFITNKLDIFKFRLGNVNHVSWYLIEADLQFFHIINIFMCRRCVQLLTIILL